MKAEFDLSKMQSRKNAYAAKLKKPVSMRLPEDVVDYFKGIAMKQAFRIELVHWRAWLGCLLHFASRFIPIAAHPELSEKWHPFFLSCFF